MDLVEGGKNGNNGGLNTTVVLSKSELPSEVIDNKASDSDDNDDEDLETKLDRTFDLGNFL